MTHERDRLSRLDRERHVFQHPVFILVSKPHVLKLDAAARAFGFQRLFRRNDRDRQVECLEDAMRRDDRRLQHVVLVGNIANRLKQRLRILDERDERAEREHRVARRVLHHAITAIPDDQRDADRADQIHERKEDCVIKDRVDVRASIFVVDVIESAQRLRFRVEDLDRLRAGKVLLQKRIDARDARAHEVVTSARAAAKPRRRRKQQRHCQQADERELHVHPQHHGDDRDDHHEVAEQIRHAFGEQLVERIDVGRQPRHDAADGIAIVVSDFLVLQFAVELFAHVEHHVLSDAVDEDRLEVGEDESQQLRREEQADEQHQTVSLARQDVPVDRVLRELRLQHAEQVQREREASAGSSRRTYGLR